MYDLTISIVTYNNSFDQLQKVIDSVAKTTLNYKLYISDNSPKDQIKDYFNHDRIEYIFNNSNNGFGHGHNLIIDRILDSSKYHLILNPDVYFDQDVLTKIFFYMEKHLDTGILMPKILYPNGRIQYLAKLLPTPKNWLLRGFLPFQEKLLKRSNDMFELRFTEYRSIMNVPYLSGCFMFIRTSVLKEIGNFDTGIFMYGEDTDLSRRVHQKYKTRFFPEVQIIHEFQKGSHKNLRLLWIHIKAAFYYFNKWGWFRDKERNKINKQVLKELGYYE